MNTLEAKKTAKKLIDLLADWDFEICLERPHKWMKPRPYGSKRYFYLLWSNKSSG